MKESYAELNVDENVVSGSDTSKKCHIPGEEGVFIFVLLDMVIFALLFGSFLFERLKNKVPYVESQAHLSVDLGIINTLVLLTSSWFIVMAIKALQVGRKNLSLIFITITMSCGTLFSGIKITEYYDKASVGMTLLTNDFFMFYFIITGMHFIHVIVGTIALLVVFFRIRSNTSGVYTLESVATYWHMVDLLWIIIFPLLYVMR